MLAPLPFPTLTPSRAALAWSPTNLASLNRRFENAHPCEIMRWGLTTYGPDITLATGFSPSGIVLLHLASQLRPRVNVFYLQTDLLFPETMALRDRLAKRLNIQFTEVHCGLSLEGQNFRFGENLWARDPDQCCHLRKVAPLRNYLADKKAWITAIRRDQGPTRAFTKVISWDKNNQVIKLCPLAGWTREEVWAYIQRYDLPTNPLHQQGYPSIGCFPCTRPVTPGEDERAGRWAGTGKTECGIHFQQG
ncbi:MAG: phosphoadenylyl-sulfate reductase [Anaerolineales bacterium]